MKFNTSKKTACARIVAALLTVSCALTTPGVWAEEAVASDIDTADAQDFLGIWLLKLDFMGREIEFYLRVVDLDGKLGATLDSEKQPEAQAIDDITKLEDGLNFVYNMTFGGGGRGILVDLATRIDGDGLVGHLRERTSALFEADFVGIAQTQEDLDSVQGKRPNPTDTKLRLPGKKMIRITFSDLELDTDDHQRLLDVQDGDVFKFTSARATKLFTDVDLLFGETRIKQGNMAENYPGVYSLWLKRVGDGWHLVFNEQPDIWGTRYDPSADIAEIALTSSKSEESTDVVVVKLEETGDNAGRIRMAWGQQVWTADFTMEQ